VEQYIDASLEAKPAEDSLLAVEDRSEGLSLGGGRRPEGGRREESRRADGRREESRRGDGRREDTRREDTRREDTRRDDARREDRSPDIRRSISEATGGSLDVTGDAFAPEKRGEGRPKPQPEPREARRREEGRSRGPDRGPHSRGGDARRQGGPRHEGRREEPRRGQVAQRPQTPRTDNPYELPMEERMRRYREKYGRRLDNERAADGRGAKPRSPGPLPSEGRAQAGGRAVQSSARPIPGASPAAQPREGLFRKLFGSTKKSGE